MTGKATKTALFVPRETPGVGEMITVIWSHDITLSIINLPDQIWKPDSHQEPYLKAISQSGGISSDILLTPDGSCHILENYFVS